MFLQQKVRESMVILFQSMFCKITKFILILHF